MAQELVIRNARPSDENDRSLTAQVGEATVKTTQAKGKMGSGTVSDSDRMSSRVLKNKKKK